MIRNVVARSEATGYNVGLLQGVKMKVALMLRNLHERGGINVYTVNLIENILKLDSETEYLFPYSEIYKLILQYSN